MMITHGSELYVSLWHPLRTFQPGPVWEQSEEWSFGQPPGAGHWQGRICRGMEHPVPLQGPGRVEGRHALWLLGTIAFRDLLVTEKSPVLQRPPDSPHPLQNSTASSGLVASLGAHPCGQDHKWLSANDKAPTMFSELSEN